jgi:hypothetical protein
MTDQWRPAPHGGNTTQPPQHDPANKQWYTTVGGIAVVAGGMLAVTVALITGVVAFSGSSDALAITEQAPTPPRV